MKKLILCPIFVFISGCATVQQDDVNKWTNVPVEALDFHKLFLTIPMTKTFSNGVEIRNYTNSLDSRKCHTTENGESMKSTCSGNSLACNNIFYIKSGKVLKYEPVGRCYTDETVWPSDDYKQFIK